MRLDHFLDDFVGESVNRFEVSRQLGWIDPENLIGVVVGVISSQRSEKDV